MKFCLMIRIQVIIVRLLIVIIKSLVVPKFVVVNNVFDVCVGILFEDVSPSFVQLYAIDSIIVNLRTSLE